MRWMIAFLMAALACPAAATAEEVDVELFLAVDVSRSMNAAEIEIQRRGYAEALASPEVWEAVRGGLIGRIAITYVEWAGTQAQTVVIPWTRIDSRADLTDMADSIGTWPSQGMRRTSISGILRYAAASIADNRFDGLRRVIDISGDGPNNEGAPVLEARAQVLAQGIIVNGLPLMTRDEMSRIWDLPDLDAYYRHCVIGGPGAFVIPVQDWAQFAPAIKRKLVLEIAGLPPRLVPAQMQAAPDYDCLAGEKLWERNRRYFELP